MNPSVNSHINIVGITDGDPFDETTWSGSSCSLFNAIKRHGCLHAGISGLPSPWINTLFKVLNFSPSIPKWKFKYHLDTLCYMEYTRKVRRELAPLIGRFTHTLQIYSHYDVPSLINDVSIVKCAYQDGNLARLLDSHRPYPNISRKRIEMALDWEKKVFNGLDYIFTFSEWLRQSFIKDYNVSAEKIIVVGAGANIPDFTFPETKRFDGKTILFVGIDFERKGGGVLLEAFNLVRKEIPEAELIIVGPDLRSLPEGVKSIGYISKRDHAGLVIMNELYSKANLFVMPSLYEPFGIVFLEAMAHGLPCIGTRNCAMPEIIDHGKTGFLVSPLNSVELANKIIELLKDRVLSASMGKEGRKKFLENYTWDHVAQKIIQHLIAVG